MNYNNILAIRGDVEEARHFYDDFEFNEIALPHLADEADFHLAESTIRFQTTEDPSFTLVQYSKNYPDLSFELNTQCFYRDELSSHEYVVFISRTSCCDGRCDTRLRYGDILDDIWFAHGAVDMEYHIINTPGFLPYTKKTYGKVWEHLRENGLELEDELDPDKPFLEDLPPGSRAEIVLLLRQDE